MVNTGLSYNEEKGLENMSEEEEQPMPYRERLALIRQGLAKKTTGPKPKKYLNKKSLKKIAEEKEQKEARGDGRQVGKLALEKWFSDIAIRHTHGGVGICMECGAVIPKGLMRHATAHLLPKKLFKSVSTHPFNYLILGAGCGCHYKTDRVDKFVQMKVWPEAARRIKEMIPLLLFDELKYLSSQLMTALENS